MRPLAFSGKTFNRLPEDLQDAIIQAGKDAGAYGRIIESTEDRTKLMKLEQDGKLKTVFFKERGKLLAAADPVKAAYAAELGAAEVLQGINAVK